MGSKGRYSLESPPPAVRISYDQSLIGQQYGWVTIISAEKRNQTKTKKGYSPAYVLTRCEGCGCIQWTYLSNLKRGLSKGCQSCSAVQAKRDVPKWLYKRATAAKQRCTNPKDKAYGLYGGRGIEFRFDSVMDCAEYCMTLPNFSREMEIDRIDTNGHYEVGNIRLVTREENVANRRITILTRFDQKYWPYCKTKTKQYLAEGLTREEIIEKAKLAVKEKRKNWRGIQARLESMTYSMPEDIIVLPYRGS